jgi:uncharacterized protein (DUF486 family)
MYEYIHVCIGITLALAGGVLWMKQEKTGILVNTRVLISIVLIILGAFNIIIGLSTCMQAETSTYPQSSGIAQTTWSEWFFILALIFLGSVSYTIAAYYHLNLKKWSFAAAFAIAVPLILIEYQFSIRGNRAAKSILKLNVVQITLLTMTFYFVNSWVLNYFIMKSPIIWWREVLAFACVAAAFVLTTRTHSV